MKKTTKAVKALVVFFCELEFVGEFEDEFCTGALHSPQGEGGPPLGGG